MSSHGDDLRSTMTDELRYIAQQAMDQGISKDAFTLMLLDAIRYVLEYGPYPDGDE
jgi:hypothetical protein